MGDKKKKSEPEILPLTKEDEISVAKTLKAMLDSEKKCNEWTSDENMAVYRAFHSGNDDLYQTASAVLFNSIYVFNEQTLELKLIKPFMSNNSYIEFSKKYKSREDDYIECVTEQIMQDIPTKYNPERKASIASYITLYCLKKGSENAIAQITGVEVKMARNKKMYDKAFDFCKKRGILNPTPQDIQMAIVFMGRGKRKKKSYSLSVLSDIKFDFKETVFVSSRLPNDGEDYEYTDPWDRVGIHTDANLELDKIDEDDVMSYLRGSYPKEVLMTLTPAEQKYIIAFLFANNFRINKNIQMQTEAQDDRSKMDKARQKQYSGLATPAEAMEVYVKRYGELTITKKEFARRLGVIKEKFSHNWRIVNRQHKRRYSELKGLNISRNYILDESDELICDDIDLALCHDSHLLPEDISIYNPYTGKNVDETD